MKIICLNTSPSASNISQDMPHFIGWIFLAGRDGHRNLEAPTLSALDISWVQRNYFASEKMKNEGIPRVQMGLSNWQNQFLAVISTPDLNSQVCIRLGQQMSQVALWKVERKPGRKKKKKQNNQTGGFNTLYFTDREWTLKLMQWRVTDLGKR